MKVSGFTILRNVGPLDYPFVESIRSLLPIVDEVVALVAADDDATWEALGALREPRVAAFRAPWQLTGRHGEELSRLTNLALARCTGAWAIYLQADEVLHEDDYGALRAAMRRHLRRDTEGLVFDYLHFFSAYTLVTDDWFAFYPRAVRVVKTGIGVESTGDAAGFVRRRGVSLRGLLKARARARIFHYGWAGPVAARVARARSLSALYRSAEDVARIDVAELFPADLRTAALRAFTGTHPAPMRGRVGAWPAAVPAHRPRVLPAWCRAWARVLSAPSAAAEAARPFLPLPLTNLRWRWRDWRAS